MLLTLERMIGAESVPEVWQLFLDEMAGFGLTRVLYAYQFDRFGDPYGAIEHALYLSNHTSAYLDRFIGHGLWKDAPMVRWAATSVGAASWRQVAEAYAKGELSHAERLVVDFNRSMGVVAGYSISFKDLSVRAKGAIGLVGAPGMTQDDVDAIWEKEKRHITALSSLLHLKVTSLPRRVPAALTQRQREALEWVAEGKTTQDIAILMGISVAMVEKHLRLAREALDVDTTAHAVAKAARLHQIFMADS